MTACTKKKSRISRRSFFKKTAYATLGIGGLIGATKGFSYLYDCLKLRNNIPMKVFAANLWITKDFRDNNNEVYDDFFKHSVDPFKMFLESILLHDQIVIPTQNFMVLEFLRTHLPEKDLFELLESDFIRFCRFNGMFGYQGGKGLCAYQITDELKPDGTPEESKNMPFCAPVDQAVDWAIRKGNKNRLGNKDFAELVIKQTDEITADSVDEKIRDETYKDILNSNYLRDLFSLRNTHMNRLFGIRNNQIRCLNRHYSGSWKGDEVDIVLSLAQTNLELYLASASGCTDSSTASPVGHVIKSKAKRTLLDKDAYKDFATLAELEDVPDIGGGVLQKSISVRNLIKLRESLNGRQFRSWFHENCRENPAKTRKEYISLLKDISTVESLPVRVIRFITTSCLKGPFALVGGIADSFFIDSLLRGNSPKFFIEDLTQLDGKPRGS